MAVLEDYVGNGQVAVVIFVNLFLDVLVAVIEFVLFVIFKVGVIKAVSPGIFFPAAGIEVGGIFAFGVGCPVIFGSEGKRRDVAVIVFCLDRKSVV